MCSYVGTHGNSGPSAALRARSFEFATYQFPKFWPGFRKAIQEFVRPETRAGVDSAHVVIGIVASHDFQRKDLNDRERDGSVAGKQTWVGRGWDVGGTWTGRGRDVGGTWTGRGRDVGGTWVGRGWGVGGAWVGFGEIVDLVGDRGGALQIKRQSWCGPDTPAGSERTRRPLPCSLGYLQVQVRLLIYPAAT
jgi:hypothetical protein